MRAAAIALPLVLVGCQDQESEAVGAATSDDGARSIPVVDAEGIVAAIEARKGRPLLVNYWARWCSPCVAELPDLVNVHHALQEHGGEVLGFAMDLWAPGYELEESRAALPGFVAARGIDFPVFLYESTDPIPVLERLEIPGDLPVTVAIDRAGRVVRVHSGKATPEELSELAALARGD